MAAQKRIEEEANVQANLETKEVEPGEGQADGEKRDGIEERGAGEGTNPLTVQKKRHSSGIELVAQPHGGALLAGGVPGHEGGGGRPKKLTRESLTDAAGKASEPYLKLRDDWLKKAQEYLDEGKIDAADKCQKAADRIQEGYLKYGIGSKVTHTLERAEWVRISLDSFRYALEKEGIDEATASRACVTANDRLSESLE